MIDMNGIKMMMMTMILIVMMVKVMMMKEMMLTMIIIMTDRKGMILMNFMASTHYQVLNHKYTPDYYLILCNSPTRKVCAANTMNPSI